MNFKDMNDNDKLHAYNDYLGKLMMLDAQGVEVKREINAVMKAINAVMGI